MFEFLTDMLTATVASPWIYPLMFAVIFVDGFFPPVPGESILVGTSALAFSTGQPSLILVGVLAALGAFAGDSMAYLIGRRIGTTRFRFLRRPMIARAFDRARTDLDRRGALLILVARYIPVGRVAVNMTAGATGFPLRRFAPLAALAGVSWTAYSIAVGLIAGNWAHDNPLLAVGAAIVFATAIGFVVDRVMGRLRKRAERRAASVGTDTPHGGAATDELSGGTVSGGTAGAPRAARRTESAPRAVAGRRDSVALEG